MQKTQLSKLSKLNRCLPIVVYIVVYKERSEKRSRITYGRTNLDVRTNLEEQSRMLTWQPVRNYPIKDSKKSGKCLRKRSANLVAKTLTHHAYKEPF